jgi:hypothetical protein
MARPAKTVKIILVCTFAAAHVFALGFWAGTHWQPERGGTIVRNRNDALVYLLCTPQDTAQECAAKLAAEWQKEREAEKDWKIAEPKP